MSAPLGTEPWRRRVLRALLYGKADLLGVELDGVVHVADEVKGFGEAAGHVLLYRVGYAR